MLVDVMDVVSEDPGAGPRKQRGRLRKAAIPSRMNLGCKGGTLVQRPMYEPDHLQSSTVANNFQPSKTVLIITLVSKKRPK